MHHYIKNFILLICIVLLTACNGFFEKDNTPTPTPLTRFAPEIQPRLLWSTRTGSGVDDEYLKLGPAIGETALFTAGMNGYVTSINKINGHINWRVNTRASLATSPGVGDDIVVVGGRHGDVIALQQYNGAMRFKVSLPGEILARPAVAHGVIVIKTVDGFVRGLSAQDGHELWSFQQVEPTLILHGSSAPLIKDRNVIVGFANGNLAKLSLRDGQLQWLQIVALADGAFAVQRMIDIDADPIVYNHDIYAATYQGKIASFEWASGKMLWSHDLSSYTGMVADNNNIYVSDAKSHLWSFDADRGTVNWRQVKLEARTVSGPASLNHYIIVGDGEGYLHWLNKSDGHFAAREKLSAPIYAAPIVENNILYVLTNNGYLAAYTLNQ